MESSIQKTAQWMGKVIKKPPMKPKLLQKPPFRFLYDVVMEVMKSTGLLEGLFTPEEIDAAVVKEKAGKINFLTKAIQATSLTVGENLVAKPSKIVAGQEPEHTNRWLQALAKCALKKLDSTDAVSQVLSGGAMDEAQPPPPPAAAEPPAAAAEQEDMAAAPPPRPAEGGGRRGKRPGKAGSRRPPPDESDAVDAETEAAVTGEVPAHLLDDPTAAETTIERPVTRGGRTDDGGRGARPGRPASARRGQRRRQAEQPHDNTEDVAAAAAHASADADAEPEQMRMPDPEPVAAEGGPAPPDEAEAEAAEAGPSGGGSRRTRRPRPATTRRVKPAGVEEASADEPAEVAGLMTEGDADIDDGGGEDTFEMVESQDRPSPARGQPDDEGDGVHGSLMRTIQEKKGVEAAATIKTSSATEAAKLKQRDVVSAEVGKLREAIQALCRSANPLGKVVDYIQEDCDAMQTEVGQWNEEHKSNLAKISTESQTIETELQQARLKLEEINRQIGDQQDMIRAMKSSTFENDARIQRLLGGIQFSAGV